MPVFVLGFLVILGVGSTTMIRFLRDGLWVCHDGRAKEFSGRVLIPFSIWFVVAGMGLSATCSEGGKKSKQAALFDQFVRYVSCLDQALMGGHDFTVG